MKKNLQQYAIIGLVIILAAGFAPLSTADDLALTQVKILLTSMIVTYHKRLLKLI
ncbi:MAG: hypothetical protein ACTSRE_16460 [Promethearchaeota archaeon]